MDIILIVIIDETSDQEENNVEYLVATTSIITGESFLESLATKLEAPAF